MSTRIAASDGKLTLSEIRLTTDSENILAVGDSSHSNAELLSLSSWKWTKTTGLSSAQV